MIQHINSSIRKRKPPGAGRPTLVNLSPVVVGNVMLDGNKESAKEMLSTFRAVSGTALSTLIVICGLRTRGDLPLYGWQFYPSIALLAICVISATYLFLLTIPKLHAEETDIIECPDVRHTARISLLSFIGGIGILVLSLAF